MPSEPTNTDILDAFHEHAEEDHAFQTEQRKTNVDMALFRAETEGTLAKLEHVPTAEDVRAIFAEELGNFFKGTGSRTKAILVGTAVVIGALTVIFGGFKIILGWLGFNYIGR